MKNEKEQRVAIDLINKKSRKRPEGWIFSDVKKFGFGKQRKNRKTQKGYQTDKEMRKLKRIIERRKTHCELFNISYDKFMESFKEQEPIVYYIIYPSGDETKLSILDYYPWTDYDLRDYKLASRKVFNDELEACRYAKTLAEEHNKSFNYKCKDPEFYYLD